MGFFDTIFGMFCGGSKPSVPEQNPEQVPAPAPVPPQEQKKPLLTTVQLKAIMPKCPDNKLQAYTQALCEAMENGHINTTNRIACFLGQIAHESNQLQEWVEDLNYSAKSLMKTWPKRFPTEEAAQPYVGKPEKLANYVYANRMGNGDTASGDGWRYRGRSPIQITGHNNYRDSGNAIGVDLLNNPDLAAEPDAGFKIAVLYWTSNNLNPLADAWNILAITQAINGGLIGLDQRKAFSEKALSVLQQG